MGVFGIFGWAGDGNFCYRHHIGCGIGRSNLWIQHWIMVSTKGYSCAIEFPCVFLFISEVLLITVFFSFLGMVLSIILLSILNQVGIPIAYNGLIWMTGRVFIPKLDVFQIVLTAVILFGCAVLASLHPSYRATSVKPAEILHEN